VNGGDSAGDVEGWHDDLRPRPAGGGETVRSSLRRPEAPAAHAHHGADDGTHFTSGSKDGARPLYLLIDQTP